MIYLLLGGIGLLISIVLAEIFSLRKRISRLEESRATEIPKAGKAAASASGKRDDYARPVERTQAASLPAWGSLAADAEEKRISVKPLTAFQPSPPPVSEPAAISGARAESTEDAPGEPQFEPIEYVKKFFTTGNVVTKIGVVILFCGFAFLLKYAAQRDMIPIQFRLIGVFLVGLGLIIAGWRLRNQKLVYGLLLQGCGVGVLYLTVYAAARFYHLLPYGFSFVVMSCLVVLSGFLSVLQDAKYLAVSGVVGGFLAPILISTGAGSHVVLFSYYALLNLGIVGVAWRKAWRELNLIGFFFTFVIASIWGGRYYQSRYFDTTEPFLILFFLYYVAVSVFYTLRQPLNLKGYVDGTLVFGLPIVAFGLQYGLVRNFEYGPAISALSLGLFYIFLATGLWRRRIEGMRMVTESFLAFGIVFSSLAIPLALDGRWTSAAWALEGGAILWVGIRQHRLLPRLFGILLQAGSGISFLMSVHLSFRHIPVANSIFIGCVLISFAGLFSNWNLTKRSEVLRPWERYAAIPLMVWGLLWWFGGGFFEIDRFLAWRDRAAVTVIHAAVSFMFMDIASRRLAWKQFSYPALLLLPVMGTACLNQLGGPDGIHLFTRMGLITWGIAFCVEYRLLYTCEKVWPEKILPLWHQCTLWFLLFILTLESSYGVDILSGGGRTWQYCAWGVVPGIFVFALFRKGDRIPWPVRRFKEAYIGVGTAIPMAYLFAWSVLINFYHGDPEPLRFLPVINPVEITQIFLLLIALQWISGREEWLLGFDTRSLSQILKMSVWGVGFLLLNAMVARTIHFWVHVPYTAEDLFRSVFFQASISILWGVTALLTTLCATRKGSHTAWIAGASILSLVVIKLFIVDLAGTGTIARIVSFLGVGSLMLLIGYFSPLPPSRVKEVL